MYCIISGCPNQANNSLGIRLRRPGDATAIWSPNLDAYLCNHHAAAGLKIEIRLTPTDTRAIETRVCHQQRTVNGNRASLPPDDQTLFTLKP